MEKRAVHFRLGADAGKLLVSVAREHIMHRLDPNKGLATITQSLGGCDTPTALQIIRGDIVLIVEGDDTMTGAKYHPETHKDFPRFDAEGWAERMALQIKDDANCWLDALRQMRLEIIKAGGKFSIDVNYKSLIKYLYDGEPTEFIEGDDRVEAIKMAVQGIRRFLEQAYKLYAVFEWLRSAYPNDFPEGLNTPPVEVRRVGASLFELIAGDSEVERIVRRQRWQGALVDKFLKAELAIHDTIEQGIKPVKITDGYSAGWLAPNGDYYGLNGEISNMLHNKIADALLDAKIIPWDRRKDSMGNPDCWLEVHGWVKVHGDWILYEGYNLGNESVSLTPSQIDRLVEYGNVCYRGHLTVGYGRTLVPAARLGILDTPGLRKLFKL